MPPRPSRWSLSSEAFARFLQRLDPDAEAAAHAYETLRAKLVDFFDWRGSTAPETLADETLDRVARKLEEGEDIGHIGGYTHAVARRVLQEYYKRSVRERTALDAMERDAAPVVDEGDDDRLPCLRRCVLELPPDSQSLILSYYEGEGRAHLVERRALAERLGLTYATLKTRAHRVRIALEECLKACMEEVSLKPVRPRGHI